MTFVGPFWANPVFWLYAATLLPFALSLVIYVARGAWWATRTGRTLVLLFGSIVATLIFSVLVLARLIPLWLVAPLRVVLVGGVQVAGWFLFADIRRLQRERRDCPPPLDLTDSTKEN